MNPIFSFKAFGHPNIRATHKTTFELTKDDFVTVQGDCIVGINSDFDVPKIEAKRLRILIECSGINEVVHAEYNPGFRSKREFVVRKSGFLSDRTFAVHADRASKDFSKEFREQLKNPGSMIHVWVEDETAKKR